MIAENEERVCGFCHAEWDDEHSCTVLVTKENILELAAQYPDIFESTGYRRDTGNGVDGLETDEEYKTRINNMLKNGQTEIGYKPIR